MSSLNKISPPTNPPTAPLFSSASPSRRRSVRFLAILLLTSLTVAILLERLDSAMGLSRDERMWISLLVGITLAFPAYDHARGSGFRGYLGGVARRVPRMLIFAGGLLGGGRLLHTGFALPEYLAQVVAGVAALLLAGLGLRLIRIVHRFASDSASRK